MQRILFLIVSAIYVSGCDPVRVLTLKTSGNPKTSVTIYGDASLLPKKYSTTGQKIVYTFQGYNTRKRDTTIKYGLGGWADETISDITHKIDSISINNSSGKIFLNTKPAIKSYLAARTSGFAKSTITIEAK